MTHPVNTPRGESRAAEAPAPIELQPRGGCLGVTGRVFKYLVGECLACKRLGVGGPQIDPRYVRKGCGIECQDAVHGGLNVAPLEAGGNPGVLGGHPIGGSAR